MVPFAVAVSGLSIVGAGVSLIGTTALALPLWRTVAAALASTFAGRLAPANVGSLATLGTFLYKQGATVPEATASLGLDAVGGVVVHVSLLAVSAVAVGQVPHAAVHLPRHWLAGLLVAAGLAAAGVIGVWVTLRGGTELGERVRRAVRQGWDGLVAALRSPRRALQLIGGSVLITVSQVLTLYLSLLALRGHTAMVTVAFVYLAGSAIAAAAPTPGGLGAFEAATVSGLALFGTAGGPAIAGVLLYRLISFWLPILPGAIALRTLRRHHHL
jgi:undecaprenyl-diphosphatase